jgi:hypothetical protein
MSCWHDVLSTGCSVIGPVSYHQAESFVIANQWEDYKDPAWNLTRLPQLCCIPLQHRGIQDRQVQICLLTHVSARMPANQ